MPVRWWSRRAWTRATCSPPRSGPGSDAGLSAREAEVLALITQGYSNREIAERSYLSINSVKTYIRAAYRKIGVTRRSQAVVWGLTHGFDAPARSAARGVSLLPGALTTRLTGCTP